MTAPEKIPMVSMQLRLPSDQIERARAMPDFVLEVVVLAAATSGQEMRRAATLSADKSRHSWACYRPQVELLKEAFAVHMAKALCEGDAELMRQFSKFPTIAPDYEITASEVVSPDGRVSRMLQKKPKPAPTNVTVTLPPVTVSIPR